MTLTIDFSPDTEARLYEEAARRGQSPAELVRVAVENLLGPDTRHRPAWSGIEGMFGHPMVGEDAQAWITRNRRESDAHRERSPRTRSAAGCAMRIIN